MKRRGTAYYPFYHPRSICANILPSRRKLQQDPNNTKWTRDTSTFGQKILRAQGWQPGEFLGAKDAPHSELHGAANASYIRVALKDDMKGLGFDKRKEDEVTGLAEFSDLLSRLNGKSNKKIEQEQEKRLLFKMNAYVQNRYGAMRFVRGGLLVGDEMKTDKDKDGQEEEEQEESGEDAPKEEKSKKRKAESLEDEDAELPKNEEAERKKRRKEEKKSKKSKSKQEKSNSTDEPSKASSTSEGATDRKSSQSKRKASSSPESSEDDEPKKSKSERKEDKRARKEQKKKDKEEKKRKKAEAKTLTKSVSEISSALPSSSASTPAGSGTSTPRPRAHVRSRFLAAKREASMDQKALAKVRSMTTCVIKCETDMARFGWSRPDLALCLTSFDTR